MMNAGMYSSGKHDWGTPDPLFQAYHDRYRFTVDLAAHAGNAKLPRYFGFQPDGTLIDSLEQDWSGERGWLNPPYGRQLAAWVEKAAIESKRGALVVMLVPARTETRWWHDFVAGHAHIKYLKGRVQFIQPGNKLDNAPFPSAVLIYGDTLI